MRRIVFNKIHIQNFLSIGEVPVIINFNKGISLITGNNKDKDSKNGCGKTAILDAFYWSLFGETIRDLKKEKIIHNQTSKNCLVVLDFEIISNNEINRYKISRTLNPNTVSIFQDDQDITLSSIPKNDEFIKELIGANEEVFKNVILMSLDNTLPFMAQKKVDKRKFVEGILQLNIFSDMLLEIRADYNETKKEYEIISSKFLEKQKYYQIQENQQNKQEEIKNNKITELKNKIINNNNHIKNLEKSNISLEDIQNKILTTEKSIEKLEKEKENVNKKISNQINLQTNTQQLIKELQSQKQQFLNKNGICPTCKQKMSELSEHEINEHSKIISDKIEISKKELNSIEENKNKEQNLENKISEKIKEFKNSLKNYYTESTNISNRDKEILSLQERNEEYLKNIKELENQQDEYTEILNNLKIEINETENFLKELQKKLQILETAKFVVSEEGVKTSIIHKMLALLNQKFNLYLQWLEAPCQGIFSETFEETLINEHKKECSYFNFSSGERKRIDLAILFMFQDLLKDQNGVCYSVNMYDELFDSALDENGINKVLEILKSKEDCSVYIISHNKNTQKIEFDNVINLEKKDGKTSLLLE